jgi:DnaJ-class molecular chaperone
MSIYTSDQIMNPEAHGLVECPHCSGYGSSLKESADRCTRCGGSGLMTAAEAKAYKENPPCPQTQR